MSDSILQPNSDANKTLVDQALDVGSGFIYGAIQSPLNGLTQLANHASGGSVSLPEMHLIDDSNPSIAFSVGSLGGSALTAYALYRAVGVTMSNPVAVEKTAEMLGTRTGSELFKVAVVQGGGTGALFEGAFVPIHEGEGDFWNAKMRHVAKGFATGTILNGGNILGREALMRNGLGASESLTAFISKELPANFATGAVTGVVAGAVNANIDTIGQDGRLATVQEMGEQSLSLGLFNGMFSIATPLHQRFVKPAKITPEQASQLKTELQSPNNEKWIPSYKSEFPIEEQQSIQELQDLLRKGTLQLYGTVAPNGRMLSWNIVERYAGAGHDKPDFFLNAYLATTRSAQSIGIGGLHMRKAFQEVRANNPQSSGIVTEIESTLGELPGSQPARRRDFYSRNGAQEAIDPYDIPLFQPDNAPSYVPQREIPGEGAIPGAMLFEPFGNRTVTGDEIAYMTRRIYVDGYGIAPHDPYLADRLNAIPRGPESRLRPLTPFKPDDGTISGAAPATTH